MTARTVQRTSVRGATTVGVLLALASAASYAVAGPFGKALTIAGWTVSAVVAVRCGFAALLMAVPAGLAWRAAAPARADLRRWLLDLVRYGLVGVAGVQLCFYTALQYAPVAVVLLIEYLAPVLLVGWTWVRSGTTPSARVIAGALLSIIGLVLVIGVGSGGSVQPLGLVWSLAAAICLASYFQLAQTRPTPGQIALPASVLVAGGLAIAALICLVLGATQVLPWSAPRVSVQIGSGNAPWWFAALGLVVLAGAIAYSTGIAAVRRVGARNASFLALNEVLFAAVVAWALLGEAPGPGQLLGAVAILGGVSLVQSSRGV